ncbi:pentapeptide repeat-containing protein [Mucilaginibacter sp.]|uniref:pentapeptide repeat-containing protein n=1 Tax=Mucilaginibacter sp. TaxID=1882438 RepID=UPI003D0F8E64
MDALLHDDKTFDGVTYAEQIVRGREFNNCTFKRCDLSGGTFAQNKFIECVFDSCNLSLAKFSTSTMNDVRFKNCKILGVNFHECQDFLFDVGFDNCVLDYASFMGKKMLKTRFIKSSLKEVNFSNVNLAGSVFDDTDLNAAVFNRTDLTGANFITAYNYDIDPEINLIKKASFSATGIHGLLSKYQLKIV